MFKGPIALGTIRTSFVLGLRLAIQAGTLLLVARMLEPEDFGAFAGIASLAVLLGTLSTFGTNLVLLSELSKDPAKREGVLPHAIPTTLVFGVVILGVYLLLACWLLPNMSVAISVLLAVGITEVILQPLFSLMATEHHALGRVARSQLLNILPLALRLATAVAVLLSQTHDPLYYYAWGYLAASMASLFMGRWTLPQPWPEFSRWRLARMAEIKHAAGFAVINMTAMGPLELDKALAVKLLPLGGAGIYAVAVRAIGSITLPVIAMALTAQPRLFRERQQAPKRSRKLLLWMFSATLGYSLLLAVALWFAAPLSGFIFGADYERVGEVIRWLCWVIPGMALRLAAGNILVALGRPWSRAVYEVAGVFVLAGMAVFFVPDLGVKGMVLALLVAEWGMAAAGFLIGFKFCMKGYDR